MYKREAAPICLKLLFFFVQIDNFSTAIIIDSSILINDQILISKDVPSFGNLTFLKLVSYFRLQ